MKETYNIKMLIAENEMDEAIELLFANEKIINNEKYFNMLIIMQLSYNVIQEIEINGLEKKEDYIRMFADLARRILLFVDKIERKNRSG